MTKTKEKRHVGATIGSVASPLTIARHRARQQRVWADMLTAARDVRF